MSETPAREAIFLADCAHVKFIQDVLPETFASGMLLALTADAHGAALRFGAKQVVAPYDAADYRRSLEQDCALNLRLSEEWLSELELAIVIEGVNLAELDRLNQFLFFQQAMYIARTAEAMIASLPRETVLKVPFCATPLAADFYLDSDIAAAIILYVGATMGFRVEPLSIGDRPLRFAAWSDRRPFLNDRVLASVFRRDTTDPATRRRVGFVPSVVAGISDYYVAFNTMTDDEVTIFDSPWSDRPLGPPLDGAPASEDWIVSIRETLDHYRQAFWHRIGRSSLPACLRDNPYLRFQFDYILTRRWFTYACYIYSAARFVRDNPLDLLIYSDHFIAEGAILAALYRRAGARTAIATHSIHACDAPFVAWHPTDSAIVRSGFAARQALSKGGLAAAFSIAVPKPVPPAAAITDRPRRILFLGNAVEAPQPLVDIRVYLDVIADLAGIPPHLSGKVELMSRLKPGVFSEYRQVHCQLYGWDPLSFERLEELSLAESIALADCVVGAAIPTSAYLEVLAQDKPLIHVGMEPYFPASANGFADEIAGVVIGADALWPEIERVLFDEAYREQRLAGQRAWFAADQEADFPGEANPLRAAIEAILSKPS